MVVAEVMSVELTEQVTVLPASNWSRQPSLSASSLLKIYIAPLLARLTQANIEKFSLVESNRRAVESLTWI